MTTWQTGGRQILDGAWSCCAEVGDDDGGGGGRGGGGLLPRQHLPMQSQRESCTSHRRRVVLSAQNVPQTLLR